MPNDYIIHKLDNDTVCVQLDTNDRTRAEGLACDFFYGAPVFELSYAGDASVNGKSYYGFIFSRRED